MKSFKWVVFLISVSLLGFAAKELFGKDKLITFTGRQSRDSRIYPPPTPSTPKSSSDTSSQSSSIYAPPTQSIPQGSSDTPSKGSYIYTPTTQSIPQGSADALSEDLSISTPSTQSNPKGSSDSYIPADYQSKIRSQDESPKSQYPSKSRFMKVDDIVYSKDDSFVIIGGVLYGLHSIVNGGEIIEILPNKVIIKFKNKKKTYKKNDVIQ